MYLAAYHFTGDPTVLLPAHDRLLETYPPGSVDLHVCLTETDGILVLDACPSRGDFEAFSQSPEFGDALRAFGLPHPRIEALGEVHSLTTAETGVAR